MTFKIEKGIPVPASSAGRPATYPFGNMEVGDSFLVSGDVKSLASVRSAASDYGRRKGIRFSARASEGGTRVWRVA